MKKKRTRKPLALARKTVRTLTEVDLNIVVGGSDAQVNGVVNTQRNCM